MEYEPVIGLEVHAELATESKMFCACRVVDSTQAPPNTAVCPVCSGMPGVLPVVNYKAVEMGLRVALALECEVQPFSLFARKNYFYPDLPKGYQISQYEYPLARYGKLTIPTSQGERTIRIRRVHLEEDTGKLTHVNQDGVSFSLVDLNRAGVPLLEIVTEPDMFTIEEARAYAYELRAILRYLGVNSGDLEKGIIRFEANVSVRPRGSQQLGTRTEIKNLNSFRAMERAVSYEIQRQISLLERGESVLQETVGWNEATGETYSQRGKEDAHDYRYFPEPDLPPLVIEPGWIDTLKQKLPELPRAKAHRFQMIYRITESEANLLVEDAAIASYFEKCAWLLKYAPPRSVAHWILGEYFAWLRQEGIGIEKIKVSPAALAELLDLLAKGKINQLTAKTVLTEMLQTGRPPADIISERGLEQVSDVDSINSTVDAVLAAHPAEVTSYLAGKETLSNWFFGQVMRLMQGKANPQIVQSVLQSRLSSLKEKNLPS